MVTMCKKCLDSYEINHPTFQIFGERCLCCNNPCVTVCMVSNKAIDLANNETQQGGR